VLALGLMFRRWSRQPQRDEGGRRRGGETFESDAADGGGGGDWERGASLCASAWAPSACRGRRWIRWSRNSSAGEAW